MTPPSSLLLRAERWRLAALMIGVGAGHGVGGEMASEVSSVRGLAAAPGQRVYSFHMDEDVGQTTFFQD